MHADRRKFIRKSILGTSGLVLASNFISCAGDPEYTSHYQPPSFLAKKNFDLGVASFDPTQSQIILWTRYTTGLDTVKIVWQLATDAEFLTIIRSGEVQTDAERDHTVAIQVQDLDSGLKLYYRFLQEENQHVSVVGETCTFPESGLAQLKIGLTSCANYEAGYFNVYEAMADSEIDLVVQVGDYIYENRASEMGSRTLASRIHEPANELLNLDDYRARYRQYRRDTSLQKMHQKKPCICVWDDHEIANDAYKNGAQNHQENEGDFEERKRVALQAYSEYLPFTTSDVAIGYRSFDIGGLAKLVLLDTRLLRDKQLDISDYQDNLGIVNVNSIQQDLLNPNRTLLGATQKSWLLNEISSNTNPWLLIAQQVLFGKMVLPLEIVLELKQLSEAYSTNGSLSAVQMDAFSDRLSELIVLKARVEANDPTLTAEETNRITQTMPYNLDAWDGYPAEREQILEALEGKQSIILSGDSHNAWHNIVAKNDGTLVTDEVATAAVSSQGLEIFTNSAVQLDDFQNAITYLIDGLSFFDASKKGYVSLTITSGSAVSDWISVDSVFEKTSISQTLKSVQIL